MHLTRQEIATVLVALQRYQHQLDGSPPDPVQLKRIATTGGRHEAMGAAGINELCEKINVVSPGTVYVRFHGRNWAVRFNRYSGNGRVALMLVDDDDPADYFVATVNVPEYHPAEGEVLIKDYSENRGVLEVLTRARVLEDTGRTYPTGMTVVHVCRLLVPVEEDY